MESNEGDGSLRAPTELLSNLRLGGLRLSAIIRQNAWEVESTTASDYCLVARARDTATSPTYSAQQVRATNGAETIGADGVMFVISPHLCPIGVA